MKSSNRYNQIECIIKSDDKTSDEEDKDHENFTLDRKSNCSSYFNNQSFY